jgi:hypothetical protein
MLPGNIGNCSPRFAGAYRSLDLGYFGIKSIG